jgi:hypothetical protein
MAHEAAKQASKKNFGACIFTGQPGCDGAHIYSAGTHPEFADCAFNIVPVCNELHNAHRPCLDWRADGSPRPVAERLWMIQNLVSDDEMRVKVVKWLGKLRVWLFHKGVDMVNQEVPKDEAILRYMQNSRRADYMARSGRPALGLVQENF